MTYVQDICSDFWPVCHRFNAWICNPLSYVSADWLWFPKNYLWEFVDARKMSSAYIRLRVGSREIWREISPVTGRRFWTSMSMEKNCTLGYSVIAVKSALPILSYILYASCGVASLIRLRLCLYPLNGARRVIYAIFFAILIVKLFSMIQQRITSYLCFMVMRLSRIVSEVHA